MSVSTVELRLVETENSSADWPAAEGLKPVEVIPAEQKPYGKFMAELSRLFEEGETLSSEPLFESWYVDYTLSDGWRRAVEGILQITRGRMGESREDYWTWFLTVNSAIGEIFDAVRPIERYAGLDLQRYRSRIEADQFDLLKDFVGTHPASDDFDPTDMWYPWD